MSVTRRTFSRLLGAVPLAAPAIAKAAESALNAPCPPTATMMGAGISSAKDALIGQAHRVILTPEQEAAKALLDGLYQKRRQRASWLRDVEPDVACMKSWAPSFKLNVMRQRETERKSLIDTLRDIVHPRRYKNDGGECASEDGGNSPNW